MLYEFERRVAIAAATVAAGLCESVRCDRSTVMEKLDRSPVTIADFGSQAVICRTLAEAFPADAIVAEEDAGLLRQSAMAEQLQQVSAQVQAIVPEATDEAVLHWIDRGNGSVADRYWTLDPIDGTKGFIRGDQYAIAIALIEAGQVQLGVMACPALPVKLTEPDGARGVIFVAVRGQGAQRILLSNGGTEPIRVETSGAEAWQLIESVEAEHGNVELQQAVAASVGLTAAALKMDSQAKYGVVAQGQAALYLRLPWVKRPTYQENVWDHAAGAIVVEEAGGRVTDLHGRALDFSIAPKLIRNQGIVASNGVLHEAVLASLQGKV